MARQKLGQHFLTSNGILEKIAVAACGSRTGLAVEIGPGRGALTAHLLAHADRVAAIELDLSLIEILRAKWPAEPRLEIKHADALKTDFSDWGVGILAGNLPYYAATAIIASYLLNPGELRSGTFLIQKEVAERIIAVPGTRAYGYFSVACQCLAKAEYLFTVPPGAFHPPPQVNSAAIRLTPASRLPDLDYVKFLAFVSVCFRQKRKTLRNNLSVMFGADVSRGSSQMNRRAEELTVSEFIDLYRSLGV